MPNDIISLLIYLLPGFLAKQIYNHYYPVKTKSDFSETAWSLFFGIIIYFVVFIIDTRIFRGFLEIQKQGFPSFKSVIALVVVAVIFGYFLVIRDRLRARIDGKKFFTAPKSPSVWAEAVKKAALNGEWAFVFMNDKSVYRGWIREYIYDPNADYQDFLLIQATRYDSNLNKLYDITDGSVYIDNRNVSRIEFVKGTPINDIEKTSVEEK